MSRLSYNTKRFTKVNKYDVENNSYNGILVASKFNQKNGQDYKLIDVIDIDFDGTWFTPTQAYIHNAEEFFIEIEKLDKTKNIAYIQTQINVITSSYVTKSFLDTTLNDYQHKLIFGDHVTIVNDNVLIAYDVVSNNQLYQLTNSYVSHEYLSDTTYTKDETYRLVTSKISEVISGDEEPFPTIREIAEWISKQVAFIEVPYDQIDVTSGIEYYIYNYQFETYDKVTTEFILDHPYDTYYKIISFIDEINAINDKIGYAEYNETTHDYAYTGILKELNNLKNTDASMQFEIYSIKSILNNAVNEISYTSSNAYSLAYNAYIKSDIAIDIASENIEKSNIAYDTAYSVRVELGYPSQGITFRELTDEEKQSMSNGDIIYEYLPNTNTYIETVYDSSLANIKNYCMMVDPVEAVGLYKIIEQSQYNSSRALYNLNNDTSMQYPGYVTLSLTPSTYMGDVHRTIKLSVKQTNYSIDDLKIYTDGLITAYQFNEILSYALSWEKIG